MHPSIHIYGGPTSVQILACLNKQTGKLHAECSFDPELKKLTCCEPELINLLRKVLTPELIADCKNPKEEIFSVLDGDSYTLYLWDEGQQVYVISDEINVENYALFAPLTKYLMQFYKKNVSIHKSTPSRLKGMEANTSIEGYRCALRRAYQMAKCDDGSRVFDDEWVEEQIKSDSLIKGYIKLYNVPEDIVEYECW